VAKDRESRLIKMLKEMPGAEAKSTLQTAFGRVWYKDMSFSFKYTKNQGRDQKYT
jgi:hypothetical protein